MLWRRAGARRQAFDRGGSRLRLPRVPGFTTHALPGVGLQFVHARCAHASDRIGEGKLLSRSKQLRRGAMNF
jgi:hypothetical protein